MVILRRIYIFLFFCLALVPAAAGDPLKLLIFSMSGSLKETGAWAGEGIALSLAIQLTDAGIRPFSRGEMEDLLTENGLPTGETLSRGSMIYVADQADADFVLMGSLVESNDELKISARLLDMKTMKQGNEFTVSGKLPTLPQMENELAWMVYSSIARPPVVSREQFRERARRAPNSAYASYIESLNVFDENQKILLLEKAVREYADFAEARFQIGWHYYLKRDYARALPHLEYGRKLPNERLQSEFMIATCRLQLGETAQAIEDYTRLISTIRHTAALNNLSVAHVRKGDNVSALRMLAEARAKERDNPAIAINLAIARYLAGDAKSAINSVEDALKTYSGNGMLYFLSSFLNDESGREAQSAEDRSQAVRFGIDVDKLSREEPRAWMRVILNWTQEE